MQTEAVVTDRVHGRLSTLAVNTPIDDCAVKQSQPSKNVISGSFLVHSLIIPQLSPKNPPTAFRVNLSKNKHGADNDD